MADVSFADAADGSRYWDFVADIHYVKQDGKWIVDENMSRRLSAWPRRSDPTNLGGLWEGAELSTCEHIDVYTGERNFAGGHISDQAERITAAYRAHLKDES
ncbi:hypothetical protein LCGC14_2579800 [marine sediment metagenome]|uniref:Uncharacterized protein n=1 Tax=marine sediment metagenome TaxID=412755 RepID=A0A0F9D7G9_9ZZZZ